LILPSTLLSNNNVFAAETNKTNSDSFRGALTSIQNDQNGNAYWVVSGLFEISNYSNLNKTTTTTSAASPILNATFHMHLLNGTSLHNHTISDFKMTGKPITFGNTTIINGTSTVTMQKTPFKDVSTIIDIFDKTAISIKFNSTKLMEHFGNMPIYGYACDVTCFIRR
jgi:hypothetical protein